MKTILTICLILAGMQAGYAQENNSRIITGSGMPARISMNVTVARAMQADTTVHNPLHEPGGASGQNPMFENRFRPTAPANSPSKNREKPMPAEKPYSGLKDVIKTQV